MRSGGWGSDGDSFCHMKLHINFVLEESLHAGVKVHGQEYILGLEAAEYVL